MENVQNASNFIAVYSKNQKKPINIIREQNAESLNNKADGVYAYQNACVYSAMLIFNFVMTVFCYSFCRE
jgi:hypothetical protein